MLRPKFYYKAWVQSTTSLKSGEETILRCSKPSADIQWLRHGNKIGVSTCYICRKSGRVWWMPLEIAIVILHGSWTPPSPRSGFSNVLCVQHSSSWLHRSSSGKSQWASTEVPFGSTLLYVFEIGHIAGIRRKNTAIYTLLVILVITIQKLIALSELSFQLHKTSRHGFQTPLKVTRDIFLSQTNWRLP